MQGFSAGGTGTVPGTEPHPIRNGLPTPAAFRVNAAGLFRSGASVYMERFLMKFSPLAEHVDVDGGQSLPDQFRNHLFDVVFLAVQPHPDLV